MHVSKIICTFAPENKKVPKTYTKATRIMIGKCFNAKELTTKLKATIQATGRLGFTAGTIDQLRLTPMCSVLLAPDSDDRRTLYMAVLRYGREDAFNVISAGAYVYLNTKQLFDTIKMDYTKNTIIFDLERFEEGDEIMGGECYKMKARIKPRTTEDKEL